LAVQVAQVAVEAVLVALPLVLAVKALFTFTTKER
jgi:hypothetical protein